jgi:predicted phosphohydrolase
MKKYNVKRCYYGHLHGASIADAVEGNAEGIEFKLVSADGLDFKLLKI